MSRDLMCWSSVSVDASCHAFIIKMTCKTIKSLYQNDALQSNVYFPVPEWPYKTMYVSLYDQNEPINNVYFPVPE